MASVQFLLSYKVAYHTGNLCLFFLWNHETWIYYSYLAIYVTKLYLLMMVQSNSIYTYVVNQQMHISKIRFNVYYYLHVPVANITLRMDKKATETCM
jgi:hypothetical protein